jgi:hypothetical protein
VAAIPSLERALAGATTTDLAAAELRELERAEESA